EQIVGVLELSATETAAPDHELCDALGQIGIQLGRTIERQRAREQLQHQQEALLQREKLAAMGSLLASVAHELNNPLAIVLLQATLLEMKADSAQLKDRARRIHSAAERCGRIVKSFLAMARQKPPQRQAVDLNGTVRA